MQNNQIYAKVEWEGNKYRFTVNVRRSEWQWRYIIM